MALIVLVGPMGAGKTTVGTLLAKKLYLPFKDSDAEIEARTGADIPWIFDVEGEQGFRDRETQVLKDLLAMSAGVIATGGGIVMREENRVLLKPKQVVYLRASLNEQLRRTANDRKRPLLQTENPREVLERLMTIRDPLYRDIATQTIETDGANSRSIATKLARQYGDRVL
ncbi:MAG: shikimate kinase AroK [Halieaceae bacterium]|nr:shikimate kinase AroK [Halieaceae bacterium]